MKARRNPRRRGGAPGGRRGASTGPERLLGAGGGRFTTDPVTGRGAEVRTVQPYAATKPYLCPGCRQEIRAGIGHVVVVPLDDPSERRHWHAGCWEHRGRRPPER